VILDANGLSAFADGDVKLEPIMQTADQIAIPAIVPGEYRYGIRQSSNRKRYERWLAEAIADCRVLVVDEQTAEHYAEVREELKRGGQSDSGE
jgi:predicted nucleic acid-binding protein